MTDDGAGDTVRFLVKWTLVWGGVVSVALFGLVLVGLLIWYP